MKKILTKLGKLLKESNEKESGFTLIDVMVTMALFALISSILLANYPDSATKVELANAVSDMQGVARDSQLKAGGIETSGDTAAGYGLYFDAASTTKFVQFKDMQIGSSTDLSGSLIGDSIFNAATEISKIVKIPEGFYLRNICVGDGTARPFATSSCSRTNSALGTVTVSYARSTTQPIIYINNATSTRYAATCIEFASKNSIAVGKVRNMIISQSGFSTTALGACDEAPTDVTFNTTPNSGVGGLITSGNTSTIFGTDKTAPVITLNNSQIYWLTQSSGYIDPGATAMDNVDGNITSKITRAYTTVAYTVATPESATSSILAQFLNGSNPQGITIDSSGNIYTANVGSNNVSKITPAGVSSILVGSTGTSPYAITIDSSGNIYTANYTSNNVSKITPAGVSSILGSTGTSPQGITIDSSGNIYTANYYSNNVSKITVTQATSTRITLATTTLNTSIPDAVTTEVYSVADVAGNTARKSRYIVTVPPIAVTPGTCTGTPLYCPGGDTTLTPRQPDCTWRSDLCYLVP